MNVNRLAKIASVFAEEGLGYLTNQSVVQAVSGDTSGSVELSSSSDIEKARRLRRIFEKLGPTFVKFGQMLASRVDLFSDEFTSELSQLHAAVTPFAHETAVKIIEDELGDSIANVFMEFPGKPIASASIAQVYRAKLKDSGDEVAVKVQRPNLHKTLLEDLDLIVQMSSWLDALVPSYRRTMMHVVAKEYASRSKMELDFISEANAIQEFRDTYADDPYFMFPKAYLELCTDKLIVMEWINGPRLGEVNNPRALKDSGFDPKKLVRNLLRIQLTMSYENGLIHADMHPGNIILRSDGKIGIIDCGLHARIPKRTREQVLNMLLFQSQGRVEEQVDLAIEISPPANRKDFANYRKELIEHYSKPQVRSTSSTSKDLIATMRIGTKYQNYANPYLLMIVRNLLILEGIFAKYDPDFDPTENVGEHLKSILMRRFTPQAVAQTFSPVIGEIAIALHNRPVLLSRVLRLEAKFAESKSLGEFLRGEDVIQQPTKSVSPVVHIVLGALLGAALVVIGMNLK